MKETTGMKLNIVEQIIRDHRALHSEYQMDHFITGGNNATPYAMYKQALREFTARVSTIKCLYIEVERKEIDLADALRIRWWRFWYWSRRRELDLIEKRMAVDSGRSAIREAERELVRFYAHCVVLKKIVGDLTEARRAKLEAESWVQAVKCRAATEAVSQGLVSKATVEMLASMPVALRKQLWCEIFDGRAELVKWYMNFEPVNLEKLATEVLADPRVVRHALEFVKTDQLPSDARADQDIGPELIGQRRFLPA